RGQQRDRAGQRCARCRWACRHHWRGSGRGRSSPLRIGPCRTSAPPADRGAATQSRAGRGGSRRTPSLPAVQRLLFRKRITHVRDSAPFAGSKGGEISPGLVEAQTSVRTAANLIGVMLVLTVVLPEADRTDLIHASLIEGEISAARAGIRLASWWTPHVEK